ncbi:TPA: helix-turn-helix transcriptional regulator [Citrobacter amalonaticus]|uniref:hypothetical protein n=1 Tax=Citrobacter amalonaticus TaxID=35703 RepID=UPI000A73F70A|nr:helix-turn-helix transcriptional regulator [Citrobacter amalonaticus]ELN9502250.1 helix-turn-helix transcriptional regulator [Citrobacter amalonaticus]ELW9348609.1 helix-turn-helix transcriptional regulator [Citrobacter amalonaticus]HCD7967329.1 helix-turn-helix transcriptional regulator [Citrobacter amalonaticus]HCD7971242.1 helix-turn-helix transcriptional regulator [Citrobacter amalonaticus]
MILISPGDEFCPTFQRKCGQHVDGLPYALAHVVGLRSSEKYRNIVVLIANALDYESDSAFGKVFKRLMGCSSRLHRQVSGSN